MERVHERDKIIWFVVYPGILLLVRVHQSVYSLQ